MEQSPKGKFNSVDFYKWGHNLLVFFAPLALIYLGSVLNNWNSASFSWEIFALNQATLGALVLYVLNATIDFFKKLTAGQ